MAETIIPDKIFFKIGEVCDLVEVQAHVLRYWETEFPMLSPKKNRSGQRTYRRKDVEIALRIKDLLYTDLFTIAGAKKRLQLEMRNGGIKPVQEAKDRDELKPGDQPSLIDQDDQEMGSKRVISADDNSERTERLEFDDEQRDALKSLVSELLELREMLKANHRREADQELGNSKPI